MPALRYKLYWTMQSLGLQQMLIRASYNACMQYTHVSERAEPQLVTNATQPPPHDACT